MAETNKLYSFTLPSPYQAELAKIADQQRLAEVLQAQSQAPTERFSYKGIEAQTPITAGLAKALQGFGGAYFQGQAREQEKALGEKYRAQSAGEVKDFLSALRGTPAIAEKEMPESNFMPSGSDLTDLALPRVPEGQTGERNIVQPAYKTPAVAGVPADRGRALGLAMQSINPMLQSAGGALLAAEMPKTPKWEKAELPKSDGSTRTGWVDINATNPVTTFIEGGTKPLPSPFALINPKDFTQESLVAATNPDGTVDRTKLVVIPERVTGNLAELAAENADRKQKGLPPLSIVEYRKQIAKAGRTPAAPRERVVYDAQRGGRVNLDTGELMPVTQGGVPIGSKERPLPAGEVEKITAIDSSLGNQKRLSDTFQDSYGGYTFKIGGEIANAYGAKFGGENQPQAEWWAAHEANDNVMRNALFGASLTAGEQKAWDKTSINPGMNASMIKNRMIERETLIDAKRRATIGNLDKAGYDVKNFKEQSPFIEKPAGKTITAINPTTQEKIISNDNGVTWQPAGR